MDLAAYCNIQDADIQRLVKENHISIPRLRGYRLMAQEQAVPEEEIAELMLEVEREVYEDCVCCGPKLFRPDESEYTECSERTEKLKRKYLITEKTTERFCGREITRDKVVGIRWELIPEEDQEAIRNCVQRRKEGIRSQYDTFNKYVGREDVLYIHARIGGGNWDLYGGPELEKEPWFIEKADDAFDSTYCDIYARLQRI